MEPFASRLSQARARQALRASGLSFSDDLERASSTRNEIYLSSRHVVRINREPNQRLKREAQIYPHLPQGPWTPRMVAVGGEVGADYLIVERKPGAPLAHFWPDLTMGQRRDAVRQLAECLRQIHATPAPRGISHLAVTPHLLDPRSAPAVRPLLDGINRLAEDPKVDPGIISSARSYVVANYSHLDRFPDRRLIHGDLTFENVLWDGQSISAVIDFEWCRGAPADLDLDVLLRCCQHPDAHVAAAHQERTRASDYANIVAWLAEDYPGLFSHPHLGERLMIYALSFEVRQVLESPRPVDRSDQSPLLPYNRLVSLLSSGGYLSDALHLVGVSV